MPYVSQKTHLEGLQCLDIRKLKADGTLPLGEEFKYVQVDCNRIRLSVTQCNYGGFRHWFVCPHCLDSRTCLYWYRNRWQCRTCTGLLYRSQAYDKQGQAHLQEQRLFAKLNEDGSKPKGMRWATYYRICDEIDYYQELWGEYALALLFNRYAAAPRNGRGVLSVVKKTG